MDEDARRLAEVWEAVKEFLLPNSGTDAAEAVINAFINTGSELEELMEAGDECPVLDKALQNLKPEEELDEDDYNNDNEDY